jgi:hypothetical protein
MATEKIPKLFGAEVSKETYERVNKWGVRMVYVIVGIVIFSQLTGIHTSPVDVAFKHTADGAATYEDCLVLMRELPRIQKSRLADEQARYGLAQGARIYGRLLRMAEPGNASDYYARIANAIAVAEQRMNHPDPAFTCGHGPEKSGR